MANKKVKRFFIGLNQVQTDMLAELMTEDAQDSKSNYFGWLVVEEYKNRKNRKRPGRPRKGEEAITEVQIDPDFTDDFPKSIFWAGRMIGKKEMDYLEEKSKNFPQSIQ